VNKAQLLKERKLKSLSWANLSQADLSGANLFDHDLRFSNLSEANLSKTTLRKANLFGADLPRANLHGADLSEADLRHADLSDTNLSKVNLSGADLFRANLSGADLREANLHGADFFGVKLSGVSFLGVLGLASMEEEMSMIILLREEIRKESFVFNMSHFHGKLREWHGERSPDNSSFERLIETCGNIHDASGFCQVELAKRRNPLALVSTTVASSYAMPSLMWLFAPSPSEDKFLAYLDDLISGKESLLQR